MAELSILKIAFDKGFEAFQCCLQNEKGLFTNPQNPYQIGSLPFKEFERGYNRGYFEVQKKNAVQA